MDAERKSRKRLLTAEEAELWTFAMREAKALRRMERARGVCRRRCRRPCACEFGVKLHWNKRTTPNTV